MTHAWMLLRPGMSSKSVWPKPPPLAGWSLTGTNLPQVCSILLLLSVEVLLAFCWDFSPCCLSVLSSCLLVLSPLVPLSCSPCCLSVLSSCPLILSPPAASLCCHPVPLSYPPWLLVCAVILSPYPVPSCCLTVLSSCLLVLSPLAACLCCHPVSLSYPPLLLLFLCCKKTCSL